ncbi:MAG: InlB B-repeat-containing protein, partial [Acholeplasmatales bacterium]|nr:InlB B-repeat-containing protein [Acholeplasmatales bacterium]
MKNLKMMKFIVLFLVSAFSIFQFVSCKADNFAKINIDYEHGTILGIQDKYEKGKEVTLTAIPQEGYYFGGWFESGNIFSNTPTITILPIGQNISALFLLDASFGVYLHIGDNIEFWGTGSTTSEIHIEDAKKVGYKFLGWYLDNLFQNSFIDGSSGFTSRLDIYAKFEILNYNLIFNVDGGSSILEGKYSFGDLLPVASKTGYTFIGWANGTNAPITTVPDWGTLTTPLTLKAIYEINKHKIILSSNGGTEIPVINNVVFGSVLGEILITTPTKLGYIFQGWSLHQSSYEVLSGTMPDNDITLYAHWSPITYSIIYNGGESSTGSTLTSIHTYDVYKNLTTNGFAKIGYIFNGWSTTVDGVKTYDNSESVINLSETNNSTVSLYAVWAPISYQIHFDGNGSTSGSLINQTHYYGSTLALPNNTFNKAGYTFVGWATTSNGTKAYNNQEVITNLTTTQDDIITLYAVWIANQITIIFNANTGTGSNYNQIL